MTHYLKIRTCFADAILSGDKTFELRYNGDRGFQRGDLIGFTPVDEHGHFVAHAIKDKIYMITYVLSGFGLEKDYVVFGIKEAGKDERPTPQG